MREVSKADGSTFTANAADISSWCSITLTHDKRNGDLYEAYDGEKLIGQLRFWRAFPGPQTLGISTMGVIQGYQGRGVGTALLERLRVDNPGWSIDPGVTTELGLRYCRHMLESEPEARAALYPLYQEKSVGY